MQTGEPERALLFFFERGAPRGLLSAYFYAAGEGGGTSRESDLDVAVLLDPALYPDRKARSQLRLSMASDLIHVLRNNHVDLLILNDSPPGLARRVATTWTRLFCTDPEADHAFVRDAQLRAAEMELFPAPGAQSLFEIRPKPFLQHRLLEVRKHLDHLYRLRPRVPGPEALEAELSLFNDVRFSLLTLTHLVIDVAAELSVRRRLTFSDCSEAVRNLAVMEDFPPELVESLALLPALRNALLHPQVALEAEQVVEQLRHLEPVEELLVLATRHLED